MLLEIIIATTIGIFCGTITGLTPGIHINLVATFLLTISPTLLKYTSPESLVCFIVAMSVAHTFLDFLPSTFLGAPDPDKAMTALPAHRLLLKGKAYEAVRLSVIGSLSCLIAGVALTPFFYLFIKFCYPFLEKSMFWILITATFFIIFKDKRRWLNLAFFMIAGGLGYISLNLPQIKDPLFPLLSGLFGTSVLITSFQDKVNVPKQKTSFSRLKQKEKVSALIGGTVAGSMTGFMPGLGASQGAAIAFSVIKSSEKSFLMMTSGIGTVNFILSIITYYTIERARNGSIIVASNLAEFTLINIALFLCVSLIAAAASSILSLEIAKVFGKIIVRVNYQKLILVVIGIILIACTILSNFWGFILLICATTLGIISTKKEIAKNNLMGCLLVPVLIYFCPFSLV